METKARQPDRKLKCGGIVASVWVNNTGESGLRAKIQLLCHYQTNDGQWQSTSRFNINDLPKVMTVTRRAYEWLALTEEEPAPKTQEKQPAVVEEKVQ